TSVTPSKGGYAFTPSQYELTLITQNQSGKDFTVEEEESGVTITNPVDGETVSGTEIVSANVTASGVTSVAFYIAGVLKKTDNRAPYRYRWETARESNGAYSIEAKAYGSGGLLGSHSISVTVSNSTAAPQILLDRDRLNFAAVINGVRTGSQTFQVSNGGGGSLNWTAAGSAGWLNVTPSSGAENSIVTVSIDETGLAAGSYNGTVTVTDAGAGNSPASLPVYLTVKSSSHEQSPVGSFDTPGSGSTIAGSVPVTGWAVDDTEISVVKIYRDALQGEAAGLVYIGDALFIDGARPDIAAQYPANPFHYRAGWGYMMLSNFLPNGGNGSVVLTAIATDSSGNSVTLGTKSVSVNNADDINPFGAVDAPAQSGEASGAEFGNVGWALTPPPNTIATDGSTLAVWVDGVRQEGSPLYNLPRTDIAALFPGYTNANGAGGAYYLDTTLLADGVHTLAWTVSDDAGNSAGIGSRYFRVTNGGSSRSADGFQTFKGRAFENLPVSPLPVYVEIGYGCKSEPQSMKPADNGIISVVIKEDQRIKFCLNQHGKESFNRQNTGYFGYALCGGKPGRLPVGSFLDEKRGLFYWQPGVGFLGEYLLVFIKASGSEQLHKTIIKVIIVPKFSH
ncbi:MAG: BACON domain-containing protein, partial [bacterium]|nr:BACON domain-containing protein [bacterium]